MAALNRSINASLPDLSMLDREHDLDALRERVDFRALVLQTSGHTREALPYLVRQSVANPADTLLALKVGALQAWFGQEKELAATRQRILALAKGTDVASTAERASKLCMILPSTDKAELDTALAMARKLPKTGSLANWNQLALGMAEYRAGNDDAAIQALTAAAMADPNNTLAVGTSAFYRAMSLFRQGMRDQARTVAMAAAAKMDPLPSDNENPLAGTHNWDNLITWLAYKEANALIQFAASPPPPKSDDAGN